VQQTEEKRLRSAELPKIFDDSFLGEGGVVYWPIGQGSRLISGDNVSRSV